MFKINEKNEIKLTRGDNAEFNIVLTDETNADYILDGGDVVTFSVKENIQDPAPILQKSVYGKTTFELLPEDTREMDFKKYIYDVQINTHDGKVYTVVPPTTFFVLEEVTM